MSIADRSVEIREYLRKLQHRLRIDTQEDMARRLEMPAGTYKMRLQKPQTFRLQELWNIEALSRTAGMSIKETGVPFL